MPPCRALSKAASRPECCAPRWPRPGAYGACLVAGGADDRGGDRARGSSTAARRRCRSAPPACCSSPPRSTGPTPSAPSTVFLQLDALRAEGIEPGPSASFALQLPSASGSGPPASCASPTGAPSVVIRTSPLLASLAPDVVPVRIGSDRNVLRSRRPPERAGGQDVGLLTLNMNDSPARDRPRRGRDRASDTDRAPPGVTWAIGLGPKPISLRAATRNGQSIRRCTTAG